MLQKKAEIDGENRRKVAMNINLRKFEKKGKKGIFSPRGQIRGACREFQKKHIVKPPWDFRGRGGEESGRRRKTGGCHRFKRVCYGGKRKGLFWAYGGKN